MKRFFNVGATALAAFYDFAVGCLIATLVLWAFAELGLSWLILIPLIIVEGFVWGLFPDFDLFLPLPVRKWIGNEDVAHHHESLMHWPFVILPSIAVLTLIGWLFFGKWGAIVGITAFFSILAHYLHDGTIMGQEGWGWFTRTVRPHWTRMGTPEPGWMEHQAWMNKNWFRPSILSVTELELGSFALGITVAILTGSILNGLLFMFLIWAGIISFWEGHERHITSQQ